ncbi:hypothetical protein [Crassaminicella profunda]|uniref:hypothetical protein n=1 Tax=Crassaminicella profunda TaxID=1286698 RepID=UPI001CA6FC0D|nr:hypothetical protein [Crassaminicella profunda]QZY54482.1 hypothetical protein K7H06_15770 [Crassaminicella profunda]
MKRLIKKSLGKKETIVHAKEKRNKAFEYEELIKMDIASGNKDTRDFLENELANSYGETVYELDTIKSLIEDIKNNYVAEDKKLEEYIPTIGEKRAKGDPKKLLDVSLDTGNLVGGQFEEDDHWIFIALLKNAPNQTANMQDMKIVNEGRAKKTSLSDVNYMKNPIQNSATAITINMSKNVGKFIQNIQKRIENDKYSTLNKVLPFISTKKEKEKIKVFKKRLEVLEDREKIIQETILQRKKTDTIFFNKEYKHIKIYQEKMKKHIEQYKKIIQRKLQKKSKFQKKLQQILKSTEKNQRKLEYTFFQDHKDTTEYIEENLHDEKKEESQEMNDL